MLAMPEVQPPAIQIAPTPQPAPKQNGKRDLRTLKIILAIFGLLVGMLLDTSLLEQPHLIAGLYFLFVVVLRIDSQKTFLLALAFLVSVPIMLAFGREFVAEQFATLSYFLLSIGVLSAAWEMNKPIPAVIGYRN